MPPHSPQCKIQMPRRRAAALPRLVVKKVGKRFGDLPFFYYFCMQITYYLDRTLGTGDRLAVEEKENLIPESGVRLQRQGHHSESRYCFQIQGTALIQGGAMMRFVWSSSQNDMTMENEGIYMYKVCGVPGLVK